MKKRNKSLDMLKGIAILLVILGHILQATTANYSSTKIHSFIFCVQMPLFIVISGYFTANTKEETNNNGVLKQISKKIIVYILPFFSREFVFHYFFISNKRAYTEIWHSIFPYNIDNGLWFLWVLFFLSISILITKCHKRIIKSNNICASIFEDAFVFFCSLIPWVIVCFIINPRFLGANLILYYSPFYYSGYCYKRYIKKSIEGKENVLKIVCAVFLIYGSIIASHYNFMMLNDSLLIVSLRFSAGFCLAWFMVLYFDERKVSRDNYFSLLGKYTLELYYIHGFYFAIIKNSIKPDVYTIDGITIIILSFIVM